MLKDQSFRKYFIRFLLSVLLLQQAFFAEQRYLKDTPQQHNNIYLRLKEEIRNKELSMVKAYQRLLIDTMNYEKNWLKVNSISKNENCVVQIFKNDTLVTWTSNLRNGQNLVPS